MTTAHINAQPHDFAKTVLMPGDPLRAKYIAENYLQNVKPVNTIRNMLGYTGFFNGHRVSVMGSGMGAPSICLYAHELYSDFGVENIIRVGSCGALQAHVALNDIVFAMGATTDSNINLIRTNGYDFAPIADFDLLQQHVSIAKQKTLKFHVGNVFTTDLFYNSHTETTKTMTRFGVLAAEMETAGLYCIAAQFGKKALTICTVSDHILLNQQLSTSERETGFDTMIDIALQSLDTKY
ncbi:purine-nucleoside phosphorylase [Aliiglaciecola litoralis]|uniref:Purine nucleoside phosphorylase DeoD-type n=1 Tax=Aliiglaciecola litoralis TaxID=582857 RepID=A0ABN1LRK0_9ALTE